MTGEDLKIWRDKWGLRQEDLANLLVVKTNTVYLWEKGKLPIKMTTELAIEALDSRLQKQKIADAKKIISDNQDLD